MKFSFAAVVVSLTALSSGRIPEEKKKKTRNAALYFHLFVYSGGWLAWELQFSSARTIPPPGSQLSEARAEFKWRPSIHQFGPSKA